MVTFGICLAVQAVLIIILSIRVFNLTGTVKALREFVEETFKPTRR